MNISKTSFVAQMITRFKHIKQLYPNRINAALAMQFVKDFKMYFESLYVLDIANGKCRKLPYLSSAQTNISTFKRILIDEGLASKLFVMDLRLPKEDSLLLKKAKNANKLHKAIDLPEIPTDAMIIDCRKLLIHKNPYLRLIALAYLTGRRTAELLCSMTFNAPREQHHTHSKYWSEVTGVCKQRADDLDPLISREVPLLVDRKEVVACLTQLRLDLPCVSVRQVNVKYGKPIQRAIKRYVPIIGNIHAMRSFYAFTCFEYMNERNCSLPRLAADYLCHKTLSDTIITYLSFRILCEKSIDFSI
jgi:hypothetical protein